MSGAWIILRCSGRHTLRLAQSLAEDGFECWTPARTMRIRKPRWNVHREVTLPLMAGFVFAQSRHLVDLMDVANSPNALRRGLGRLMPAHPVFRVFHLNDRIPLIADQELEALRQEERTGQDPADLKDLFRKGEKVMVTQGIFGGMGGIVERVDGVFTLVRFGSRMRVKISTFILEPNSVITRTQAVKAA